jgi:polyisoprenoid-binding protein YceI
MLVLVALVSLTTLVPITAQDRVTPSHAPSEARDLPAHAETRLVLNAANSSARYRVREQLAGVDFPNDAVGHTTALSGEVVFDDAGAVIASRSKITVDLRTLKSDRERRDGYIQRRTLETEQHPMAELAVTGIQGMPRPLPTSGELAFTLTGNLTIRGVTRPTTWQVTATATPDGYRGSAKTSFTFADFNLAKPRVAVVLSVEDQIALELDFHFERK